MIKAFKLKMIILVIMIPCLFLLIIFFSTDMYKSLYNHLLQGFKNKLLATTTTLASFIDGDEHQQIANSNQIRGLAFDSKKNIIYASYFVKNIILKINAKNLKVQELPNQVGISYLEDLTYNINDGYLYAISWGGIEYEDEAEPENIFSLIKINTKTGLGTNVGKIGHDCYGLTYVEFDKKLYCNNEENIIQVSTYNGKGTIYGSLGGISAIRGLAYNNKDHKIYAINTNTDELIKIDIRAGEVFIDKKDTIQLIDNNPTRIDQDSPQNLYLAVFGLAFNSNKNEFIGSSTMPLLRIHPKTGLVKDLNLQSETYLNNIAWYAKYALPMIKIKESNNLTFLYTSILTNEFNSIYYVLDSAQDTSNSFVGYVDPDRTPDDIKDVWLKGETYVSEIQNWEEWGNLLSAYVPIRNNQNQIKGIAGADVNTNLIEEKSKQILIIIFFIGFVSITLGVLIALYIARKLVHPLEVLKANVLKIAAGNYNDHVEIKSLKEIESLSKMFNQMRINLMNTVSNLSISNKKLEEKRKQESLVWFLSNHIKSSANKVLPNHIQTFQLGREMSVLYTASSSIIYENQVIFWYTKKFENSFQANELKNLIAITCEKLLRKGLENQEIFNKLNIYFKDLLEGIVIYNIKKSQCFIQPIKPIYTCFIKSKGDTETKEIKTGIESFVFLKGQICLIHNSTIPPGIFLEKFSFIHLANMNNAEYILHYFQKNSDLIPKNIEGVVNIII